MDIANRRKRARRDEIPLDLDACFQPPLSPASLGRERGSEQGSYRKDPIINARGQAHTAVASEQRSPTIERIPHQRVELMATELA